MNVYLILFFLIRLVLAVNILDNRSRNLVQKCSITNSINCNQIKKDSLRRVRNLELNSHSTGSQKLKKRSKRRKLNFSVNESKELSGLNQKILKENLDKINFYLFNNVRTSNRQKEDNQINKLLNEKNLDLVDKNQHDSQHTSQHNKQHDHSYKKSNEYPFDNKSDQLDYYLKEKEKERQKLEQASKLALDSLKSLFEIELPELTTPFNDKFLLKIASLIKSLIEELNHIKIKLEQTNCRMRLSFKNKRITSDCDLDSIIKDNTKEPCNCVESDSIIEQKITLSTYQTIDLDTEKTKTFFHYQEQQSIDKVKLSTSNLNESIEINSNNSNNSSSIRLNSNRTDHQSTIKNKNIQQKNLQKESTENSKIIQSNASSKHPMPIESTQNLANNLNVSSSKINTHKIESQSISSQSTSKKETELSKQLGSAIECFLCQRQWSKCFNVGFKCF